MSRLGFASLLVVAVGACDPATLKHTPDAAKPIDGAPDAPNHGVVTVTLYDPNNAGTLIVGAPVVFIEADGTVVGKPLTDSLGIAKADVHDNATATAVIAPTAAGGQTTMMTIAGIQPGDHINLGPSKLSSNTTDGTFTVSYPAYSGAAGYNVVGPCGYYSVGNVTTYAITIDTYCKQTSMDLLVVAYNASNTPLAYLEKANVPYTAGGSTTMNGQYLLPGTFNADYTNVDAAITNLSFNRQSPANNGYSTFANGTPANGTLSLSGLAFNAQTSSVITRATRTVNNNIIVQNMPGNALSYSLDLGTTLLPWVGPAMLDAATQKLSIGVDTTGTSTDNPDLFYTTFAYSRTAGSAGTLSFRWYILAPAPGDVTLPALPTDVGDVLPQATDTIGSILAISIDSSQTTWNMVRLAPFDFLNTLTINPDTTTRFRESVYQPRGT